MAAVLIDDSERLDNEQFDQLEKEPLPEVTPEPEPEPEDDLPEKYRNKSVKDLVRMHQEAEKHMGKQGAEVGELRKVVDSYIQSQLANKQAPKQAVEEDDDDIDFFTDPDKAVARAIEKHPKMREAEQVTQQYRKQTALSTLQRKHPDMQNILNDGKFADWIKASSVRTKLFIQADQQYDYEAADELFSLWKDRQQVVTQTANAEKAARKQQVKTAATGTTSGNAEAGTAKKIYRRADIIKLMKTDPERYQALSDEIMKAYAEGRVK